MRLAPASRMIWRATGEAGSSGRALACPDPRAGGDGAERQDRWTLPGCGRTSPTSRCTVTSYRCSSTPTCSSGTRRCGNVPHLDGGTAQAPGRRTGEDRLRSDNVDDLTTFLEGLGRDHRKFGVVAEHYDAGGSRACWRPWNISRAGLDERSVYFLARLSRATRPWRSRSLTSASTSAPRRDGQHGSDQRSHGAAAPGPGLSTS